jgi:hypothetical protein
MVNGQLSIRLVRRLVNHSLFTTDHSRYYSVLKLFTGLAIAARTDLYPTVIQAINTEHAMANINTQIVIVYPENEIVEPAMHHVISHTAQLQQRQPGSGW